jgi:hypothetical protein
MKAILELEMPENCYECLFYKAFRDADATKICCKCVALNKIIGTLKDFQKERYSGCPLKPKDEES